MNKTTRPSRDRKTVAEILSDEVARLSESAAAKEAPRRAAGMVDVEPRA